MVFDKFVGKQVIWSGVFDNEGERITYILFGGPTLEAVAIKEGEDPQVLEDAESVLQDLVSERFESAKNIMGLAQILRYSAYEGWVQEKFHPHITAEEIEKRISEGPFEVSATQAYRVRMPPALKEHLEKCQLLAEVAQDEDLKIVEADLPKDGEKESPNEAKVTEVFKVVPLEEKAQSSMGALVATGSIEVNDDSK